MESQTPNPEYSSEGILIPGSNPSPPPIRVLIIDDDLNLCNMLQDMLEEYKFTTTFAQDESQGVSQMVSFKPDVVLVDFRLENITGIEVGRLLKRIDEDIPIILMTAYPSLDLAVKAIQNDIYDFVAKPVDRTYLLRSISKASEKRLLTLKNKELVENLKKTNAQLDRTNHLKSKFLSIVTHDLRTPLTSIRGYTDLLKSSTENLSDADRQRCFEAIDRSVERMNGLIVNLMDIVSIESGKLRIEKTEMDYLSICKELQQTLEPIATSKKINLLWELPTQEIPIYADASRLIQALTNLISNGFKHVPENGTIQVIVSFTEDGQFVLTQIIDNGEGIPEEAQSRLFDQFYQVETSPTRRQGLGLGLTITREILQEHEGEIGVYSEGLGKGAQFWFTLPLHIKPLV